MGGPLGLGRDQVPHVGLVVVVGVVRRHLLDTGGDAPHRLDVRLRGRPARLPLSRALPYSPRPPALCCLPSGVHVTLSLLAPGPPPYSEPLVLVRYLPSALWNLSCVPTSVICAPAFSAGAHVLPVPLPVSLALPCVSPSNARALARPVCLSSPAAAGPGCLPVPLPSLVAACALACPLRPFSNAAARAAVLTVPLPVSFVVPCVLPCAARAPASPVCLSSPASSGSGALPVSLPSLIAACALARPLRPPPGAPSVAFRPLLRAPVTARRPARSPSPSSWTTRRASCCRCTCSSVMPGGVRLGAAGRTGRSLPSGKAAFGGYVFGGAGVGVAKLGVGAVLGALPAFGRGCGGRQLGARGPFSAPAACRGPRRGQPARHRSPWPIRPPSRWQGPRPEWQEWPPWLARVPGLAPRGHQGLPRAARSAVRPVLRPPPADAPRALRGFCRVPRGHGGAGAGLALVAVVPLGGAIGVRHRCCPGRHTWLQACPSHYLLGHQWRAVGSAVWCCEGGGRGEGWWW